MYMYIQGTSAHGIGPLITGLLPAHEIVISAASPDPGADTQIPRTPKTPNLDETPHYGSIGADVDMMVFSFRPTRATLPSPPTKEEVAPARDDGLQRNIDDENTLNIFSSHYSGDAFIKETHTARLTLRHGLLRKTQPQFR